MHSYLSGTTLASDYAGNQSLRTLRDVLNPKVRGSALWVAHALMSASHEDASDRRTGSTPQHRQAARILRSALAGREWLADRQQNWPGDYHSSWWIDVRPTGEIAAHHAVCDINC